MVLPAVVLVILSVFHTFLGCTGAPITSAETTFDKKEIPNIIFTTTGLTQGNRGPDHEISGSRGKQASRSITPTITDVAVALPTTASMPQHDAIQSSDGSNSAITVQTDTRSQSVDDRHSAHPASTNGSTSVPSPSHVSRPSHDENKAGAASGSSSSGSSSLPADTAAGTAQDITDAAAGLVDGAADAANNLIGNELFAFGRFRSFGPSCKKTFFGCR